MFEKFIVLACVISATVCLIAGRVETFHVPEGEAFVYGWKYWTATIVFACAAGLIIKRRKLRCLYAKLME